MSVHMIAPPSAGGVVTNTPSGTAYAAAPGSAIAVQPQDQALMLDLGYTFAATPAYVNALATGGGSNQATATQLGYGWCPIASSSDFVALPAAVPGAICILVPTDGTMPGVYAKNGTADVINGSSHGTLYDMISGSLSVFTCSVLGHWRTNCAED